jgi:N-acetylmuramoyl-L-alanine amidase
MHIRTILPLAAALSLAAPAAASAYFVHTVAAGESLSSVAAADGLTVDQLAAVNGLSSDSPLIAGATLSIPPQSVGSTSTPEAVTTTAPVQAAPQTSGGYVVQPGDTLSAIAARAGTTVASLAAANGLDPNGVLLSGASLTLSGASSVSSAVEAAPQMSSAYVVQPGDTLSAIAARSGATVAGLAAANGLDPNGILLSGSSLTLSGSSSASATSATAAGQPIGAPAEGSSSAPPFPTPETVSASEVGSIASANGVSPSLAEAIGWQESGFNNDLVSSADARGVMQILPGTWSWIQSSLAGNSLAPASAADNVRGGVLMLHSLLNSSGGDASMAAAGYYQGLASVQQNGIYASTQQYVNDVMALAQRFGGG